MRVLTTSEFIKKANEYAFAKGIKLIRINYLGKKNIRNVLQKELL